MYIRSTQISHTFHHLSFAVSDSASSEWGRGRRLRYVGCLSHDCVLSTTHPCLRPFLHLCNFAWATEGKLQLPLYIVMIIIDLASQSVS